MQGFDRARPLWERALNPIVWILEHFEAPSTTVNDAFRAVSRYWDRIVRPEQILHGS